MTSTHANTIINVVGVYVNDKLPVVNLKIRVYGVQAEYVRMLPVHKSQSEVNARYGEFAEFTYRVCLTPELKSKILAMGSNVEVLEPSEYREEIKKEIRLFKFQVSSEIKIYP